MRTGKVAPPVAAHARRVARDEVIRALALVAVYEVKGTRKYFRVRAVMPSGDAFTVTTALLAEATGYRFNNARYMVSVSECGTDALHVIATALADMAGLDPADVREIRAKLVEA